MEFGQQEVKSDQKEKTHDLNTNRMATRSTSSFSNSNSPKSSQQRVFKSNIAFPSLRSSLNRRNKNNSTIQFRTNESVEEVKEDREEDNLEFKLPHPKMINDKLEFNNQFSIWNERSKIPRGKSVGALISVDQQKQEVEVRIKNKYNSKVTSLIDKDQFNTGVRPNLTQKIDQKSRTLHEQINSIAQIEQSKQGLSVSINMRSSLKQIVDQADPPSRQSNDQHQQPIESIQQQQNDNEVNEQPLLRVSLQKLQGQQDLMKKIYKSQSLESNTQNEPVSSRVTESILQQNENQNQNQIDI